MALQPLDSKHAVEFANADFAKGEYTEAELDILNEVQIRKQQIWSEQTSFQTNCDRFDVLYYPEDILPDKGASHWAYHQSATLPGKAHVSVNTPPTYVDIPASLQSIPPVENVIPMSDDDDDKEKAVLGERLYFAWKDESEYELKGHRACVSKALYGRTAGKVWWDKDDNKVNVDVVDQPRNLWLGWGQSDYRKLDWAAYIYLVTADYAFEKWGLVTTERIGQDGRSYPYLVPVGSYGSYDSARREMWGVGGQIEVIDYWYKQPKQFIGHPLDRVEEVEHETWNAIIVGNRVVKNMLHSEYGGDMPYVPLFNTFIPGVPNGRAELHDVEQLIREKDERLTSGSQLMHNIVNAQYWQLVGPDSPDQVPLGLRPKANQVVAPGSGNRIEKIEPWAPEFQLESFMTRIDREMVDVTGLNDLLRGLAPASVMSSSKAISALVANYETRIRMKRDLYYKWRKDMWRLVVKVWAAKDKTLAPILEASTRLDMIPPSLTPRDDAEAAQIAANLMGAKVWSQRRAMDRTGVDDPEAEQDMIREERTDATMFPAEVQMLAQLLAALKNMGFGAQPEATAMAEEAAQQMADMRAMGGGQTGMPMMNGEGEQPMTPPEMLSPGATPPVEGGQVPPAAGGPIPLETPGSKFISQSQMSGGQIKGNILSQVPLGEAPTVG